MIFRNGDKELSQKYNLAPSTIYNVRNNRDHYLIGENRRKIVEIDHEDYKSIYKLIANYFRSWRKSINIRDLIKFIKLKSNIDTPYHKIREIVKNKFHMNYNRLKPRSRRYANRTTFAARCLFSAKFTNAKDKNHLIIDECSMEENSELIILGN